MILLVIGPSGSGKSTIVSTLSQEGLLQLHPTWTDRPAREGESDGIEHRFATPEHFEELLARGFFMGTTERFGHRYGLAPWPTERQGLLTVVLRADLVDTFSAAAAPEAVLVYQVLADRPRVEQRLRRRCHSPAELRARLHEHDSETALGTLLAERSFSNDADPARTIAAVRAALLADITTTEAA